MESEGGEGAVCESGRVRVVIVSGVRVVVV